MNMADLLEDIIEESKQEDLNQNFKKYIKIALIVFIVLLMFGLIYHWWKSYREDEILKESAQYMQIQNFMSKIRDQKDMVEGLGRLEKLYKEGDTIYSIVAGINLANINDAMGRFTEAAKIYAEISSNDKADDSFKAFAALMKVSSEIKSQKFTIAESLSDLGEKKNDPFDISRKILKASLLLELNKPQEARTILEEMKADGNSMIFIDLLIGLTLKNKL
jgi:predicted negative regulator of RcsB-dependent stress response